MKTWDIIAVLVCIAYCGVLIWLTFHSEKVKSVKWKLFWLPLPVAALVITKQGPQ